MAKNLLIEKSGVQIRIGDYSTASATALKDPSILPRVQDYRRQTSGRMFPLDRNDVTRKIPTADFHVSRKIDGEFTVLYYDADNLFAINSGGTIRIGLPWLEEAGKLLRKAGIKQAMIAGELHITVTDRRCRIHDVVSVVRQPASKEELQRIRFAVFDIVELDGETNENPFCESWNLVEKIFDEGELVAPVESRSADSARAIQQIFKEWVEDEGAEGVIARSDSAGMFKIKPRYNIDVAVIGFTESTDDRTGMMHDLLLAIVRNDGAMHVMCRVGGGFSDEIRREMLSDLKDMVVNSEYAEVNSDHVAYQMVRPEWVIEISCLDMISRTTRGAPVNRMALNWNAAASRYEVIRRLPLVSVISPQFIRRRDDKSVNSQDVRIDQVSTIVEVPMAERDATQMKLPKSEVIRREVYTKELKGETMVRKFMLWKTNKEKESDEFPGYVLHYTDFSPNRKVPLSREIRVSNSIQQIESFWLSFKEAYIKKGWAPVGGDSLIAIVESDQPEKKAVKKKPATRKTTKPKAVKKKADDKPAKKKVAKKKTAKSKPAKKKTEKD